MTERPSLLSHHPRRWRGGRFLLSRGGESWEACGGDGVSLGPIFPTVTEAAARPIGTE